LSISRGCFDRRKRLVKSSEYQRVFGDKAQRISGGGLSILARGNHLDHPRLGIVVSSRVARTAVARNRIKRLVRESFRLQQARLKGWDVVVIARPDVVKQTNQELLASLEGHWKKLEQCARSSST
jgi:ribonuclease P protein component